MLRVQTVSLSAEPYSQHLDAREPAPAVVLVHERPPAHLDEEEFLSVGASVTARPQKQYDYLGDAS